MEGKIKLFFHRGLERLRSAKTMYRRLKSFLILIFAALAIFQVGQLWFVNLSNRNFFLFLSDRWRPSVAEGYQTFVRPMRVIYGDGTGRFHINYSGLMDAQPRDYFDIVLTEVFSSGTFVGARQTDYAQLLSRPILMFQYAFDMPANIFPIGFNQRTGDFLTSRGIEAFDSVAIWLPHGGSQGLSIFFMNDGFTWEFSVESVAAEGFPVSPVSTIALYFVSAALEGYEELPPGAFIPRSGDHGQFAYYPVVVTNPYHSNVGSSLSSIRHRVSPFFDNPATINQRVAGDGVWTFSNIHTTVRYFDTDVLEYASFRPRRRNVTSSLMGNFSAALDFIEKDNYVVNEIFLKGYEPRGAGHVFWFGYIVNYFPILMPDGWQVSSPEDILPAPIEVVVEEGRVVLYRRLAHNFALDSGNQWMHGSNLDLDVLLFGREESVAGLSLGYHMRPAGNLRLEWRAY